MRDKDKSKQELITELCAAREEIAKLNEEINPSNKLTNELVNEVSCTNFYAQNKLNKFLSPLGIGLYLINRDMVVIWTNDKMSQLFPYQDQIGELCHKVYRNRDTTCPQCPAIESFNAGKIGHTDYYNPANRRWFTISAQPVQEKTGEIHQVLMAITDITTRKRVETTLLENEARLHGDPKTVLEREGGHANLEISDFIDIDALQAMMDNFHKITGMVFALLDLKGTVLIASGWQDICTRFHRVHPETAKYCRESDVELSKGILPGDYKLYRCKNNMWDIATPLIVGGKHVGNLFMGQFLFDDEEIDREFFRQQAQKYGFDEYEYLAALDRLPRWRRDTINTMMRFYSQLAEMIASLSYGNIKLTCSMNEKDALFEQLRQSQERLSLAVKGTRVGLWDWRVQTGKVFLNEEWASMVGYTLKDLQPLSIQTWTSLCHPEDLKDAEALLQKHFQGETKFYRCEMRMRHKEGHWVWVLDQGKVFEWDNNRKPIRMAGTHQDITQLKQAEQEQAKTNRQLQRQLAYTEALLKAIPISVFSKDTKGRYLDCNQAFTDFMGVSAEDIRGKTVHELWPCEQARIYHEKDLEILRTPTPQVYEAKVTTKNGVVRDVIFSKNVFLDEAGRTAGIIGTFLDITQRKETEKKLEEMNRNLQGLVDTRTQDLLTKTKELETANRELLALDKLKSALLTSVSHELRTPVTSVLGFAKLIHKEFSKHFLPISNDIKHLEKKGKRIQSNLEIIQYEGKRLTRMINDFLDLTKIESGRLEWHDRVINPVEIIHQAVNSAKGLFVHKSEITLVKNFPPTLPAMRVDSDRIEQVIINLLSNAAKFTHQGSVTLSGSVTPNGMIQFRVSDTGEGIPLQEQSKIFDKFHQVSKRDTQDNKTEGTGLGLAICKEIVTHYQGHIKVKSEEGKGSEFIIELPTGLP
ncbi:PocR ligand-binding domain-containing protein [Desulfovibrio inopinatus]|uniref:PocR ligand-binding domain-containing protein n=1 Tax=Desulfovibrio inopinatus TaxID=102109 RepID=UPI0003FDA398|nr:PocR ligand-binding domain-containing protein [Desulfovibrio inopinatus]